MKKKKKRKSRVGENWLTLENVYCVFCDSNIRQNPAKRNLLGCKKCNFTAFCPDLFRLPRRIFFVKKRKTHGQGLVEFQNQL